MNGNDSSTQNSTAAIDFSDDSRVDRDGKIDSIIFKNAGRSQENIKASRQLLQKCVFLYSSPVNDEFS